MLGNAWKAAAIVLVIAVFIFGFFYLMTSLSDHGLANEIILPMLAIAGVIIMLGALALVSVSFATFQLQDKAQALGLPEGSIRAVIALSLIVLFAILTVYLYSNISQPSVSTLQGLTEAQRDEFIAVVPKERIVGTIAEEQSGRYTIAIESRNPAGDDFAKQILVLLGTLVTSISSFYFGAKAGAAGGQAVDNGGAPSIRSISPASRKADGSTSDIEVTGENLSLVKEVKIVSGSRQTLATGVLSNDSVIKCALTIASDSPAGTWDVIVTDSVGRTSRLQNGMTITA